MATQRAVPIAAILAALLSINGCHLFHGKDDPDRKFIACRIKVAEQGNKKGLMVIIENSADKAFNIEWVIDGGANLAIKKGNMIVNQLSTETYFHEALDPEQPVHGEVKLVRFVATTEKALSELQY
jgi:hypothetical protein